MLSVNYTAYSLIKEVLDKPEVYGVNVSKTEFGATIIDAGIERNGGYRCGEKVTEICLGGCGKAKIQFKRYGEIYLPTIFVYTDHPALATLGSQFAGWRIKHEDYFAMASGPARALAMKPKEIYRKIGYKDEAKLGILFLEANKIPPESVVEKIARDCGVDVINLYIIVAPTSSLVGSIQISGRVVETGIHRLSELGLDPNAILYAWGSAPVAPVQPEDTKAMGLTNDSILYGGIVHLTLKYDDEETLKKIVESSPSSTSNAYGKPFIRIFEEADYDFYKIDPKLFAPSTVIVNNLKSGRVFAAGSVNKKILRESFGLK